MSGKGTRKCRECSKRFHVDFMCPDPMWPNKLNNWWCPKCIQEWEADTGCHWGNGKPIEIYSQN